MAFACNINRGGRWLRIAAGAVLILDGMIMWHWKVPGTGMISRLLQGVLVLAGAFCVFEGVVGWCAFRAMGIKTRV